MQSAPRQPVGVSLRDAIPQSRVFGDCDVFAQSCTTDPDAVRPGDVYFALDTDEPNGAARAVAAVDRGARAVVTDHYLPIFNTPQYVAASAAEAYSHFCHELLGNPSNDLTLAVVAGAHGKSSVARLLTAILRTAGDRCGCLADGLRSDSATNDRREGVAHTAASVARWMGDCVVQGCRNAVLELSTEAGLDRRLAGAKTGLLCLTNLRYDGASGRSPAAECRVVERTVSELAPFSPLVANADDQEVVELAALRNGLTVTYGFKKPADISGEVLNSGPGGQTLMVTSGDETVLIDLPYIGPGVAQDALAAIASAVALGVSLTDAARGAETAIRLPGVMRSLTCGQPFLLVHDQANSAERLRSALNGMRTSTDGRVLVVLPENACASVSSVAHALGDLVIAPAQSLPEGTDRGATRCVEDRFSGFALAVALAEPSDAVLVAGASTRENLRNAEEDSLRQLVELRLSNTKERAATT